MDALCPFPGPPASVELVGGKAASLMRMLEAGLPVPPGATLTTAFFEPWFAQLRETSAWRALAAGEPESWTEACAAVKAEVPALEFDADQREVLDALDSALVGERFAVRSSSPQEDLASASFAGGYETCLGVTRAGLEAALRRCFASSLDARVLHYKRAHGFDPLAPSVAVVVQAQVASEVAGVGFSIDPLTNDYDHAVFDAAWGLGEVVVSGAVSPDHFVVDKHARTILERRLGTKQRALHLDPESGTRADEQPRQELCLSDAQLLELADAIGRIEALFGFPVDIEWAYAGGELHLLQARAITAWVPLPESMATAPGERRRLYMDIGLSGGLTINAPITALGESWMAAFTGWLVRTYLGELPMTIGPEDRLWMLEGGRMYQDLSNLLRVMSPAQLAKGQEQADGLSAAILANIERDRYRARRRPSWMSPWLLFAYPRAVWRMRRALAWAVRAAWAPEAARERFDAEIATFEAEMRALPEDASVAELIEGWSLRVIRHVIEVTMPGMAIGLGGLGLVERLLPTKAQAQREALTRGFEGNVVVEMGAALFRVANLLEPEARADPEALADALQRRALPEPALAAWDDFLARFGWRGPDEVDLGSPRYADAPIIAARQLCTMGASGFDPHAVHERSVARRRAAAAEALASVGPLRRRLLRRALRWVECFAGVRDTPKHEYLLFFAALRRRARAEGQRFVDAGRLDDAEDFVHLRLEQLEAGREDPSLDLRALAANSAAAHARLRRLVKRFPAVIDSRGRILGPAPSEERPGELRGHPISAGVARGRVKVLERADAKPVLPGEVLVAHTTDPGWTPLFVNAGAIVLEVGGVLQHGAVVAREYGKPCVAGIPGLLERLEDGQLVEVDGGAGVVRIVSDDEAV